VGGAWWSVLRGVDVIRRLQAMGAAGVKILCTGSVGVLSAAWPRPPGVDLLWGKPLPSKQNMRQDLSSALLACWSKRRRG